MVNEIFMHGIDLLERLGFKKEGTSSVFSRNNEKVLSPLVSKKSVNGYYWFDIRKVNFDKLSKFDSVLIRLAPDKFIFENKCDLSNLTRDHFFRFRKKSGEVHGFNFQLIENDQLAEIWNTAESGIRIKSKIRYEHEVAELLK